MMKNVWMKLKNVKAKPKLLHKAEFANMEASMDLARTDLQRVQSHLQRVPNCPV